MGLTQYQQKRNFKKTPEPSGGAGRSAKKKQASRTGPIFVIQQHHASHAHFDLRLEVDGVLKSWAVPKGPSLDPADKRLAVEVEDHPLEYASFEGTIPEGYGAGTVIVWDAGTWNLHEGDDPSEAHRRGSMKVELHGTKLQGTWALVRMKGSPTSRRHNWLFIKERDRTARPGYDVVAKKPKSLLSGRVIEDIPRPESAGKIRTSTAKKPPATSKKKTAAARRTTLPRMRSMTSGAGGIPGTSPGNPPRSFTPQLATLVDHVPESDEWLHEVKFDGYRLLAFIEDSRVRLLTRKGLDWTEKFPETRDAIESLGFESGVLDGEVVALDSRGISSFQSLQRALTEGDTAKLIYFVFDIPYWGGFDLTSCRLADRLEFLRTLFDSSNPRVRVSEHIDGHGDAVLKQACRLHLEGILSKQQDAPYETGRTTSWVKVKCTHRQEIVIGGYTDPKGNRGGFGSLLMGYFDDEGQLVYSGKVGAGFDTADLASMARTLKSLEQDEPAFENPPRERGLHWVEPRLVAEVGFTEWTSDSRLRHPVFLGLREDKEASEVTREKPRAAAPRTRRSSSTRTSAKKPASSDATIAGVRITHPERVVYPASGLTKLQVAEYYETVADQILPLLSNRPLSLVRCPGGSTGQCFFHKHIKIDPDVGLRSIPIEESSGTSEYAAITDLSGLIYLVQMNTLEFHPWGARIDSVDRPDRLVFDLDPGEGTPWKLVPYAANKVRGIFEELGMRSFVMTSGGKGFHVVVPIQRRINWDQAKAFARSIAEAMATAEPTKFVANMSKAKRKGKVFIDYLRVQRGATSVAPYSTRARPNAGVAMPIEWEQVESVKPDAFTVLTAPKHIASRRRDPWKDLSSVRQSIPAKLIPKSSE